jgi:hypothetical protein
MFCGISVTLNFTAISWSCKVKFLSSVLLNLCVQAEAKRQTYIWFARVGNTDQDSTILIQFSWSHCAVWGNVNHECFLERCDVIIIYYLHSPYYTSLHVTSLHSTHFPHFTSFHITSHHIKLTGSRRVMRGMWNRRISRRKWRSRIRTIISKEMEETG